MTASSGQLAFGFDAPAAAAPAPAGPPVLYRRSETGPYRIFHGDDPIPCVAGLIPNLACAEAVVRALNGDRS